MFSRVTLICCLLSSLSVYTVARAEHGVVNCVLNTDTAATALAAGDLDADDDLDVLVLTSDNLQIARNTAGTLALEPSVPLGGGLIDGAVVDVDRDGRPEIAVLSSNGRVTLFDPELLQVGAFAVSGSPAAFAWADVNDDGLMDVAIAGSDGVQLYVLSDLSSATSRELHATVAVDVAWAFVPPHGLVLAIASQDRGRLLGVSETETSGIAATSASGPLSVLWAEVDNTDPEGTTGVLDAVFVASDQVEWLELTANGATSSTFALSDETSGVAAAGDTRGTGRAALLLGSPCGPDAPDACERGPITEIDLGLEEPTGELFAADQITAVLVVDLDGDRRADAVIAGDMPGNDGVAFTGPMCWAYSYAELSSDETFELPGNSARRLAFADVDRDGHLDVAVLGTGRAAVVPLPGAENTAQLAMYPDVGGATIALADLNGDGWPDFALATPFNNTDVYLSDNGQLPTEPTWSVAEGAQLLSTADVDGDGLVDLVAAHPKFFSESVSIYLGPLDPGTEDLADLEIEGVGADTLAWGDINGDRRLDLAAGTTAEGVKLYRNVSTPGVLAFEAWDPLPAIGASVALRLVDWNGDGTTDLMHVTKRFATLYRNTGGGTFALAWQELEFPLAPTSAEVIDWDADGDFDLAVGWGWGAPARVLLQTSMSPEFGPEESIYLEGSTLFGSADIDGDGRAELIGLGQDGVGTLQRPVRSVQFGQSVPTLQVTWPVVGVLGADGARERVVPGADLLPVSVAVHDPDGDRGRVSLEYSVDGGGGWQVATQVQGQVDGVGSEGTVLSWDWARELWPEEALGPNPPDHDATEHPIDHDRVVLRVVSRPEPPRVAGRLVDRPFVSATSPPHAPVAGRGRGRCSQPLGPVPRVRERGGGRLPGLLRQRLRRGHGPRRRGLCPHDCRDGALVQHGGGERDGRRGVDPGGARHRPAPTPGLRAQGSAQKLGKLFGSASA